MVMVMLALGIEDLIARYTVLAIEPVQQAEAGELVDDRQLVERGWARAMSPAQRVLSNRTKSDSERCVAAERPMSRVSPRRVAGEAG